MTEEIGEKLSGLGFKIEKFEDSSMSNGENAFIIYLTVDNKISSSRKLNLLKATYVTHKREQLEQDIWLSGYITGEDTLKPNSFKKAGLVFYKNKLKSISDNDIIYITAELPQEGKELTISFKKEENKWQMTQVEKTDLEIKFTPKQLEKILLKKIERLDAFEERLNVSIEKLSIKVDNDDSAWFTLYGELHTKTNTELEETIKVVCVIYDKQGSIIEQDDKYFLKDSFFGFEVFEFRFQEDGIANEVGSIRIYPKK
jgi:hypothetical protein